MPFICAARALKNARHLQAVAPHIIPKDEPAEGFASLVPFEVLSRLQQMTDAELQAYPQLSAAAKSLRPRVVQPRSSSLFKGTVHFERPETARRRTPEAAPATRIKKANRSGWRKAAASAFGPTGRKAPSARR
jgi:hypothetical protein